MHHIFIFIISSFVVSLTLLLSVRVSGKPEMSRVELGYPMKYLVQDISRRDPPEYPIITGLMLIQEYPIRDLYFYALLIDILIVWSFLEFSCITYRAIWLLKSAEKS